MKRALHATLATVVSALTALIALPFGTLAQGAARYVNASDATCGGHSPCYATIQTAVTAALAGDTIIIQAGSYTEQVKVTGKNNTASATEADRIVITADPNAPVGSVVLHGTVTQCTNGFAVRFQQSKFVTIRGLTITGAGGQGISLMGGNNQNQAIHIERNRIVGNATGSGDSCNGGIVVSGGNPGTLIVNNLIDGNGRDGVATLDAAGGPHYLIGNTIHANAWNGVDVTGNHEVYLVNNAITANGTASGTTGGRVGVQRQSSNKPNPAGIHLLNNLICGNRLGEIAGPVLDGTDSNNLTPTGSEGPGVSASPGCNVVTNVYANVAGADGLANTLDDDFTLTTSSPAIDRGMDPRTLGLDLSFNALFEADYAGAGARPKNGTHAPTPAFDIGALEFTLPDTQAPAVTIQQPAITGFVRQTVTVQAQAIDDTAVATLSVTLDGRPFSVSLAPTPPAASVTATASWNTMTVPDGSHTLAATASDGAGNTGSASRVVIVDNTPPDTQITGGPSGTTQDTTATFTFTGTDNLTPSASLVFSFRLDGGAFSPFSSQTMATFTGLAAGPHTFEVKARDLAGNEGETPALQTFTVSSLSVTITEPINGATVPTGVVLVRGTVQSGGAEVGVTVNSVPAAIQGNAFAAALLVDPTTTTITAIATTTTGTTAASASTVTVSAAASFATVIITPSPATGVAPMGTRFTISGLADGTTIQWDFDGDGVVDATASSADSPTYVYSRPGVYVPTATFVDSGGVAQRTVAVIQVFDAAAFATSLQSKWSGMRDSLRVGDIPGALTFVVSVARPIYDEAFRILTPLLPNIDAILTDLRFVEVYGTEAFSEAVRIDGAQAVSFEVRFIIDADGVWRIESF
jgi:hypothetical protein